MQVVQELPSERGRHIRVCGASAVSATERGRARYRVALVLQHNEDEPVQRVAQGAPYRLTPEGALADLPHVAWGTNVPIYEEVLAPEIMQRALGRL